jgi:hypothetical protein
MPVPVIIARDRNVAWAAVRSALRRLPNIEVVREVDSASTLADAAMHANADAVVAARGNRWWC